MSTEVFVAILEDRHCDTEVYVFSVEAEAVEFAKEMAEEFSRGDEIDEEMNAEMVKDGWVYRGCYSCEGDSIHVVKRILDEARP